MHYPQGGDDLRMPIQGLNSFSILYRADWLNQLIELIVLNDMRPSNLINQSTNKLFNYYSVIALQSIYFLQQKPKLGDTSKEGNNG